MPDAIDLDHLAVAAERLTDLWPRYVADLGGEHIGGADSPGFRFAQVVYANGMKIEGLEPRAVEENDFLRRFLDASGPGPHHVTFKVPDLVAAIAAVEAAGFPTIGGRLDDPDWKEAFIHPKAACGIVVQLAQSSGRFEPDAPDHPVPAPRRPAATLVRLVHLVADAAPARALFAGVLGGRPADEGSGDLAWPGGGRIRLVVPAPGTEEAAWLAGRPGRLHHVVFRVDDPAGLPGARPQADGTYLVDPADNLGVRLVLTSA